MNTSVAETAWSIDSLQLLHQQVGLGLPEALTALQQQALQQFVAQGFPTRRNESWKYSPLTQLASKDFQLISSDPSLLDIEIAAFKLPQTTSLVFVDGVFSERYSDLDSLGEQVTYHIIGTHTDVVNTDIEGFLQRSCDSDDPMEQLNAALLTSGLVLRITAHTKLSSALHILHVNTGRDNNAMHHPCCIIHLGDCAEAVVIEDSVALNHEALYWINRVTDITLDQGAILHRYQLQRDNAEAIHLSQTRLKQARDSHATLLHVALGAKLARDSLHVDLHDSGACCTTNGYYHAINQQHLDHHLVLKHAAKHTESKQFYRGVIDDSGVGIFSGKAEVDAGVSAIQAQQTNNNLLMSDAAKAYVRPQLEIYADDIQCSHGATVGKLDEKALFYCRSRGIPISVARKLLLQSFIKEVFTALPESMLIEAIQELIFNKLAVQFEKRSHDE